jgi:hypothetical protein
MSQSPSSRTMMEKSSYVAAYFRQPSMKLQPLNSKEQCFFLAGP